MLFGRSADAGIRIEVTTVTGTNAPVTTYYLVDGNNPTGYAQVIEQGASPGTPTITYIWGETLIEQDNVAGTANAGTYYLIADAHGSTRMVVNSTGGVVQTYNYDSSGNALGFNASTAITQYLYNQQFFDIVSGQYYMRARNYDPATGTFTQQDTISLSPGDLANANLFLFAGADPANMFDPSGHDLMETLGSIAISNMISSIISPVIGPLINTIGTLLIPSNVLQTIENGASDVSAFLLALSGTLGGAYKGFGGFGTGGLELLASPHTGNIAAYRYGGGGGGYLGGNGLSGSLSGSVGAVWRTPISSLYTGAFYSVTIGFRALPARARAAMASALIAWANDRSLASEVGQGIVKFYEGEGKAGFGEDYLLQQALDSTRLARDIVSNSNTVATIFWSPTDPIGSVGFSVGESVGTQEGGFSAAFSVTDYQQIWPYGSVSF